MLCVLSNALAPSTYCGLDDTSVVLTHLALLNREQSFAAVPAPGQLSLLSPPADSRWRVSVHLAEEVHRIVCQHHLVHRLFGEHWPL